MLCRWTPRFVLLLLLSLPASTALAAWPHDPTLPGLELRPAQIQCYGLVSVPDGLGGAFFAWDESQAIRAQHVDAGGRLLWGSDGLNVYSAASQRFYPALAPDGAGGVVIAWEDSRSGSSHIYAQRVNAAGALQWAASGVSLSTNTTSQYTARIVADGAGGAVVAWLDYRSGSSRCYARAINAAGTPQWASDGIELGTTAAGVQSDLQLIRNRAGRYVVVWTDTRADVGDIYFQQVGGGGNLAFAGGATLGVAANTQYEPRLALDSGQGVVVSWTDLRSGTNYDVYAQRLNFVGGALWAAGGVPVCTAALNQTSSTLVPDAGGGAYVAWSDNRNSASTSADIYAQHLSSAGSPLWATDGIAVCTAIGAQQLPRTLEDATGGVFIAWQDARTNDSSNEDAFVQRLNSAGTAQWTAQGVAISTEYRDLQEVSICTDGGNGLIASWGTVVPTLSNAHATVARVDEWGYLGAEPVIVSVRDVPNDQGGLVKLSWDASPLDTDPLFRNISQYWLYRSAPPNAVAAARRAGASIATSAAGAGSPPRLLQTRFAAQDYYWEIATSLSAAHLATYSELVGTSSDSVGAGNPRTAFMVLARNSAGTQWWTSAPDSGYSVDNLPPAAPAPFTGQYAAGTARLHWNPNAEADVAGYELYRGGSAGFTPGPASLVTTQPDTGYADAAGAPFVYKLLAVDAHGNRSPVATLTPAGTLDVGGQAQAGAFFAPPSPNPSRSGGTLRFGLATAGTAKLALYDAQGRCVRVLFAGALPAGEQAIAFDGRDGDGRALAPGLYLARLTVPGFAFTRRMAVID